MSAAPISPSEADLRMALASLKNTHPALGIPKIHAKLLETHTEWTVSEKRTRKILQAIQSDALALSVVAPSNPLVPTSRMMPESAFRFELPLAVSVHDFGLPRGKGLVTTMTVHLGETLWKEDPWILAPEWAVYALQQEGQSCSHCSTPFRQPPIQCDDCGLCFCNRLCLNRARDIGHRILCTQSGRRLLVLARDLGWQALHALAKATARILQTHETHVYDAFAVLGMEERFMFLGEDVGHMRKMWERAFLVFKAAFDGRKLGELGTMDGFLRGLGRMSLNLESHGGLYTLHSHMNHSCEPNVSVRHLQQQAALARITVLARRDISRGEELTITYVDPELPYRERRRRLLEWGFICTCQRCEREEKETDPNAGDLALELKEGFGVL